MIIGLRVVAKLSGRCNFKNKRTILVAICVEFRMLLS